MHPWYVENRLREAHLVFGKCHDLLRALSLATGLAFEPSCVGRQDTSTTNSVA